MKIFSHLRMTALALVAAVAAFYPAATVAAATAKVVELANWIKSGGTQLSLATLGANTLTGLIPTLYAALDTVAREFVGFIPAVARNPDLARAAKGQTVTSYIAPPAVASDIVPGVTAPNDGDQVFGNFPVTLTKARYVPVRWNGEEQLALANGNGLGFNPMLRDQFAQGFRTLTNEMEVDMALTAVKGASRAYGTAGTTPFGTSGDLTDFSEPAKILDVNGTPPSDRHMIVNANAMSNIRGKQSVLFKVNEAGTDELLRRGTIGEAEGFGIGYAPAIALFTKGTGTGYLVNNAGPYAIGTTTIIVDTGTGTILAGDVVTFAGDTNKYVVGTALAANQIVINSPGLRQTLADNVAITVGNSYTPNVAFQRNGLILATRLPALPVDASGQAGDMADDRMQMVDPFSGLAFEVSLYRQYRQIKYEIGIVWGQGITKSDFVTTLLG